MERMAFLSAVLFADNSGLRGDSDIVFELGFSPLTGMANIRVEVEKEGGYTVGRVTWNGMSAYRILKFIIP